MKDTLLKAIQKQSNNAPRSLQTAVGPSELGGCTRALWYKTHAQETTNPDTKYLAAWMGTAIHAMIEKAFGRNKNYLIEQAFEHEGLMGHIDLIDVKNKAIWDWKTSTKTNLAYFPTKQQITQVQVYGYLARANGLEIDTVGLIAIARDGNEDDVLEWSAPYNPSVAAEAINRLLAITLMTEPPAPEKDSTYCANYCQFFGVCPGRNRADHGELILDSGADDWAKAYVEAQRESKAWDAKLNQCKAELSGVSGTTLSGIRVTWTDVSGRTMVDEVEVEKALGFVPKKQGAGYTKLTVKA